MNYSSPLKEIVGLALGLLVVGACTPVVSPSNAAGSPPAEAALRHTPTADVATFVIYPQIPLAASPPPGPEAQAPLLDSLVDYDFESEDDPTGAKTAALVTLHNFVDANGPYRGAWWFETGQGGDLFEALAVIFYTEGSTNLEVRKAIAARYLWYCGGESPRCQGHALINFLAYFQAWREPWRVPSGFANAAAKDYLALADDVVNQRGIVLEWIPGAEWFAHNAAGLQAPGPVDWETTPFHFANVHPTWDVYLRRALGRPPNGPNRLWVLTIGEANQVCGSRFVCPDMTQARP